MLTPWDNRERSVWLETAPPCPDCPPLAERLDVDLAVIGAGYAGSSCALHAALAGLNVALIDAVEPGWGAAGRSAGALHPHWFFYTMPSDVIKRFGADHGRRMNALVIEMAAKAIPELIERHGIECDYEPLRHVHASLRDSRRAAIEKEVREWNEYGARDEVLDRAQLREVVPTDQYKWGLRFGDAGILNPLAYVRGLARAAQDAGAALHGHSPVRSLLRAPEGWLLKTPEGEVRADRVYIATNAYESGLWHGLDRSFVRVTYGFIATEPLPDKGASLMLANDGLFIDFDYTNLFGWRLDRDGRLGISVMAPTSPHFSPDRAAAQFMHKYRRIFPANPLPPWKYVHWGHTATQFKVAPRAYRLAPGVYAANGYCANGIVPGTGMGRELARYFVSNDETDCAFPITDLAPMASADALNTLVSHVVFPLARLKTRFLQ